MTTYYTDIAPIVGANMLFGYQQYSLNQEVATKYYKIEGITSGGGWTPQAAQQLGAIASGTGTRFNVPDFMQRTTPASPVTEDITLRISRYPDNTYTDPPEAIADRVVTHKFIDSGAMTLLNLDNFDDGTVQGWTLTQQESGYFTMGVDSTYHISPAYSLRMRGRNTWSSAWRTKWGRASKPFVVPSASEAYLVINVMVRKTGASVHYTFAIYNNGVIVAELNPSDNQIIFDKWMRLVIPLETGITNAIDLHHYVGITDTKLTYIYFDDLKIVYS